MPHPIYAAIDTTPIFDVHEHHMPAITLRRDVNLLQLFRQSYADWTRQRPYPLPGEPRVRERTRALAPPPPTTWEALAPYLENSSANSFVRNLETAILTLHAPRQRAINRKNWEAIDAAVRARHADPAWCGSVLDRARIIRIVTDPYADPLLDAPRALGPRYASVLRINSLACAWHPAERDHNGNSGRSLLRRAGLNVTTFDDFVDALETLVATLGHRHQVALKNALAYDRDLAFDPPHPRTARAAWNRRNPSPQQRKAFSDFVVDRLCSAAAAHDVPVQMHLGTAIIRGSHPLYAAGLFERHPRTRFLLMHLAYPWSRDLLGLAFVYRNLWLDLTWSVILSPSHFRLALDEALDVLPDDSRLMLGGDNWHVEETYGTLQLARREIAGVLEHRILSGHLRADPAQTLARRILHDNAASFFGTIPS